MKEMYERTQLAVTEFQREDVIITSGETPAPTPEQPTDSYQLGIRM